MRSPFIPALLLVLASFSGSALAQERAATRARRALEGLDPAACRPSTGFEASSVPLAIVIHRGGAWALAIGPVAGTGLVTPEAMSAFRGCLETALASSLPQPLPRPPRTATVVARTWTIADPAAEASVEPARQRLQAHDGTEGAICTWGRRHGDVAQLPEPRACRAGLHCCAAGGAAGSDSTCVRASRPCPRYP